jgi:hypothetical protein
MNRHFRVEHHKSLSTTSCVQTFADIFCLVVPYFCWCYSARFGNQREGLLEVVPWPFAQRWRGHGKECYGFVLGSEESLSMLKRLASTRKKNIYIYIININDIYIWELHETTRARFALCTTFWILTPPENQRLPNCLHNISIFAANWGVGRGVQLPSSLSLVFISSLDIATNLSRLEATHMRNHAARKVK